MHQPEQHDPGPSGTRQLSFVPRGALASVIHRAVVRSLDRYDGRIPLRVLLGLRGTLERSLMAGLRDEGRRVTGMTRKEFLAELERRRDRVLLDTRRAEEECEAVKRDLDRVRSDREELVQRVDREFERREQELGDAIRAMFAEDGDDPERLEGQMIGLAVEALRETHNRLFDDQDQRVDLLERRVAKLNHSLSVAEQMIRTLQAMKNVEPGVASIYRTVQGLSLEEDRGECKRAMLQVIFESNMTLRQTLRQTMRQAG
jgi:hypothetical protein